MLWYGIRPTHLNKIGHCSNACPLGTRIVYERAFLMQMRQSPLARSPPANLPVIPGVTVPASTSPEKNNTSSSPSKSKTSEGEARKSSMDPPTKLQTVNGSDITRKISILFTKYLKFVYSAWKSHF